MERALCVFSKGMEGLGFPQRGSEIVEERSITSLLVSSEDSSSMTSRMLLRRILRVGRSSFLKLEKNEVL